MLDGCREAPGHEVRIVHHFLGRVHNPADDPPLLESVEARPRVHVGGDERHGGPPGTPDLVDDRVLAQFDDGDATSFHRHFEQDAVREGRSEAELLHPVENGLVVPGVARREADGDIAAVGRPHLRGRGRRHRGVPPGLPLHGVLGHQPFVRPGLGGDVQGGVHVHTYVLAHPRRVPVHDGGQRRHGRVDTGDVRGLTSQAADRRQRMVVVAAVPHRATPGHQGEVGDGIVGPWPLLAERRHGHPDQGGRGGHERRPGRCRDRPDVPVARPRGRCRHRATSRPSSSTPAPVSRSSTMPFFEV